MMDNYQDELARIKALLKKNPEGMSVTEIAKALDKNKNTVGRYLDILLISGHVMVRNYGMAKVFTLSQRVPLSAMLSYSNELIMVLDKDERVVEINDQFLALLGCMRNEVIGKNSAFLTSQAVDLHEIRKVMEQKSGKPIFQITIPSEKDRDRTFRVKNIATVFDDGSQGVTILLEDITDQVLAENALKASEERFRLMAEHIQDILIIAENGKVVYANQRLVEMTGFSFKEMEKLGPNAIVAKESQKDLEELTRQLETGGKSSVELRIWIVCKDKSRKYMYGRLTSHVQEGRQFFYLILTDLTQEKEAENALRESERRFRLMAENLREGILIVENEKIVFANRSFMELTGYSSDEIFHIDSHNMVSLEDQKKMEEIARRVEQGEIPSAEIKIWITRKDGDRRFMSSRVTSSVHGDTRSIYVTATDITDSLRKDTSQQNQIRCFQRVIDTLPHAMYSRDCEGRFLTANSFFGDLIGKNSEDLQGKFLKDFLDPETFVILTENDEKILQSPPEHYRFERSLRDAGGRKVPVIIRKEVFLASDGKIGGIVVSIYPEDSGDKIIPGAIVPILNEMGPSGSRDPLRRAMRKPEIRKKSIRAEIS